MSTIVAAAALYTLPLLLSALPNSDDYTIREWQKAESDYKTFQVDLTAIKKGVKNFGPIARGKQLAVAKAALEAKGYVVEDRNGYTKKNEWVNWPHLHLYVPGTSYNDSSAASNAATVILNAHLAAQAVRDAQQAALVQQLISLVGASNPAAAAAIVASNEAATAAAVTPVAAEETATDVVVEADETPQGETNEESFADAPAA
mgnify:CR=1 FL=1